MPLEPVHVMEMDRSTSRLELVHINPTRTYALGQDNGSGFYTWQNGAWYDTGGNAMRELDVPQQLRDDIAANPIAVTSSGPTVTEVCKFCGEKLNQSAMNQHYIQHVENTLATVGTASAVEEIPPPVDDLEPKRLRK